jgi:hypothetical protein
MPTPINMQVTPTRNPAISQEYEKPKCLRKTGVNPQNASPRSKKKIPAIFSTNGFGFFADSSIIPSLQDNYVNVKLPGRRAGFSPTGLLLQGLCIASVLALT